MSPALDGGAEDGSAVVEFVLVSVLVVVLLLALVQVGLALHIRNTLISAASEGARFAAAANQTPSAGAEHTRSLIRESLPDGMASDVTAGQESVGGVPTIVVTVRVDLPVVGWLGPSDSLVVSGHAMEEQ
ncbi:MAG TPA: TadE/TadG family type IV pilus assembly protein [Actinomycetes bacterium]|nr:TadE/TadG family type IV pilus assembly protein [Actinomycetes bacterium]